MMKKLTIYLLISFVLFSPSPVSAQSAQGNTTVKTTVGNPIDLPSSQDLSSILQWDTQITSSLSRGIWNYYNKLLTNISGNSYRTGIWAGTNEGTVYWCTYSIIDSYNLAGIPGLSKSSHAAVVNMRRFWRTTGVASLGYIYVDYQANKQSITLVKPGFAMFMERVEGTHTGYEHVAMVKAITLDENGNGSLISQDSNSSSINHTYPIKNYAVQGTTYPIRGFGGV